MTNDESKSWRPTAIFLALACAFTWALATPMALAWWRQVTPPPYAVPCAGLSAFGPLFAALVVSRPRRAICPPRRSGA